MYDCDESGLNNNMQNRLQGQYRDEQQERKRRIIRSLDNDEIRGVDLHGSRRDYYIAILARDYGHKYINRRKAQ